MTRLDAMLRPGESVTWCHDPESSAGDKWPYLVAAGVPLTMVVILGSVVLWNVDVAPRWIMLVGLLFLLPTIFAVLPLLFGMGSLAVAVTFDRMLWRRGLWRFQWTGMISRADIASATVYEGNRILLLHHRDGRSLRLRGLDEPEPLARALRVRMKIWRKGEDAPTAPESFRFRFVSGFVSVLPLELVLDSLVSRDWELMSWFGVAAAGLSIATFVGAAIFHVRGHVASARKLSPQDRKKAACRILNPLCRGAEPPRWSRPPLYAAPVLAFNQWLVRKAYGGPYDCDCEPQVIEPEGHNSA